MQRENEQLVKEIKLLHGQNDLRSLKLVVLKERRIKNNMQMIRKEQGDSTFSEQAFNHELLRAYGDLLSTLKRHYRNDFY